jgi:predicted DNA-binding protein
MLSDKKLLKTKQTSSNTEKIKTTVLIDKRLKKLAQVHGIQNDKTLSEVIEEGLERVLDLI